MVTESFERKELCKETLGQDDLDQLREAVEDLYYFEFVYGGWSDECADLVFTENL